MKLKIARAVAMGACQSSMLYLFWSGWRFGIAGAVLMLGATIHEALEGYR